MTEKRLTDYSVDDICAMALAANWRPIETAPKDGTHFLGYWRGFGHVIAYRHDPNGAARSSNHRECWVSVNGPPISNLTHWMPLPAQPI